MWYLPLHNTQYPHSVHPPPLFLLRGGGGGGGGGPPPKIYKKGGGGGGGEGRLNLQRNFQKRGGGFTGLQLLEGGWWERGG